MPYGHLWPAPLYNIFPHYLINSNIYKKSNSKCVFWLSLQLLSETFLILRRTERDVTKTERGVIKTERDGIKTERDVIKTERDVIKTERDVIKTERDGIKTERDVIKYVYWYSRKVPVIVVRF
jgi:hypothetical protein